jgi:integrase
MGSPDERGGAALPLDDRLIGAYLADCRSRGLSDDRVGRSKSYLGWWGSRIPDLRRAELRDLDQASLDAPNRGMRINVLKAFWSWLLRTGRIDRNPTEGLQVPPPRVAQVERSKVVPEEHHLKVLEHLDERYRDLAIVLHGTGCHISELERFVVEGRVEQLADHPSNRQHYRNRTPFVLTFPHHKSKGAPHRLTVDLDVAEAAGRARERGAFHRRLFYRAFAKAVADSGVKPAFSPAQYRHTLATRMVEGGADVGAVSAYLGHRSTATTRKFYATMAAIPSPRPG